jgi:hypothetical protein
MSRRNEFRLIYTAIVVVFVLGVICFVNIRHEDPRLVKIEHEQAELAAVSADLNERQLGLDHDQERLHQIEAEIEASQKEVR